MQDENDCVGHVATWSVIAPCLPIVVMVVRVIASDWEPLGDAAYFALRSRDVLTSHHPLLGAWSSGSSRLDESVNNLGPLQLDALAPFTKIGGPAGVAIGVGLLNVAAVVGGWAVARRLVGPLGVLGVVAATVMLELSMGSRSLVEARQQWALMLPMWCLIMLVWALACGRTFALVPLVVVASLVAQTHLTFALVALPCVVLAAVGLVVSRRSGVIEPLRRPLAFAAMTTFVCWAQPLWDQFFDSGNIGRVVSSNDVRGVGATPGLRLVADVFASPPFWLGDSIARFETQGGLVGSTAAAWRLGALFALAIALAVAVCVRRSGPRSVRVAAVLGPIVLLISWRSTTSIPRTAFGIAEQNYRWMWPLAAFVTCALGAAMVALLRERVHVLGVGAAVAATACLVIGILPNLVTVHREAELRTEDRVAGVAGELRADLRESLGDREVDGPFVFDRRYERAFSPFGYSIMMGLQSAGVEFVFDNEIDASRFRDRSANERQARSLPRLYVVTGSDVDRVGRAEPEDVDLELVAAATGVTPQDDARRRLLDRRIVAAFRDGQLAFDRVQSGNLLGEKADPLQAVVDGGRVPADRWQLARTVGGLFDLGLLTGDERLIAESQEWFRLQRSFELERVAVYIETR